MMRDLYDDLGVRKNATQREIRSAFRRAARRTHPDVGGNAERFRRTCEAYAVLRDPAQRAEYDREIVEPEFEWDTLLSRLFGGVPYESVPDFDGDLVITPTEATRGVNVRFAAGGRNVSLRVAPPLGDGDVVEVPLGREMMRLVVRVKDGAQW